MPPELPYLPPNAAAASVDDATEVVQSNRDYALDIEGYLVCVQLAESDAHEAAARGEMRPVEERVAVETLQAHAAEARGRQSHWGELYERWAKAWVRAHHKELPSPPAD